MERNYHKALKKHDRELAQEPERPFFETALEHMKVRAKITKGAVENIPESGPIVVVANHPFGIVDGLILNQLMHSRRKDYYILTNEVLLKADRMVQWLLPIDDSETAEGTAKNRSSILKSMHHLKSGGALCVFPAGRLARPLSWFGPFEDRPWQPLTAHFLTRIKASEKSPAPTLVPIYFEGNNSILFRIAAMFKMFTITRSLVIHECMNKQNKEIGVRIGRPIKPDSIPQGLSHDALAAWMRDQTLALGDTPKLPKRGNKGDKAVKISYASKHGY